MNIFRTLRSILSDKKNKIQTNVNQKKFRDKLKKFGNEIDSSSYISTDSELEGKNRISKHDVIKWSKIGYGTYMGENCYFERTKIGRYCSIAKNVDIVAGNHPTSKFVSTHPAFYSTYVVEEMFGYIHEKKYRELRFADEESKTAVIIGNDVWISSNASIMEGVTIGDGAVIAANALVTKNVEPFEIVGGVPAKHIKWRFNEEQRAFLNDFKWWDKPVEWIKQNAESFDDIDSFIVNNGEIRL